MVTKMRLSPPADSKLETAKRVGTWGLGIQGGFIVAVRCRAVMPSLLLSGALVAVAACSNSDGSDEPTTVPSPSIVISRSQPALKAATDCSQSKQQLPPESQADGVVLQTSTDRSRTSLLLKNTGSLSVVVIPDASFTSRLVSAPQANPTDQASKAALIAVNNGGGLATVQTIPAYVPRTQVVTLPPGWAVCALTDNVDETASVRYLQDRTSSAEYFVAKGLADQLLTKHSPAKTTPALIRCAKATVDAIKTNPGLPDIELYAGILGNDSPCHSSYKSLVGGNEHAAQQLGSAVLNQLEGAPRLVPTSALFETTA
jgi:hypothetical protein